MKLVGNELVTMQNLKTLGEYIAVSSAKSCNRFMNNSKINDLYNGLVCDVFHSSSPDYVFSNGYDLAMEAICFLGSHIGKRLDENVQVLKYNKYVTMTLKSACHYVVNKLIREELRIINKFDNIDDCEILTEFEPFDDFTDCNCTKTCKYYDTTEAGWDKVDFIISQLNLTDVEYDALQCFLCGMSCQETAKEVHCGVTTAWDRKHRIQKKYLEYEKGF